VQSVLGLTWASLAAIVLALISGCAQPAAPSSGSSSAQSSGPVPEYIPADRRLAVAGYKSGGVAWVSLSAGYSIDSKDPGFRTTIEELQKHQQVELVLGRPATDLGAELYDSRYTPNGAKEAIDTILNACGKRW